MTFQRLSHDPQLSHAHKPSWHLNTTPESRHQIPGTKLWFSVSRIFVYVIAKDDYIIIEMLSCIVLFK